MIIRSQDKKSVTTDLNIQIYDCDNGSFEIVNGTVDTLGIYSTEEKAIKVLDMIEKRYLEYERSMGGSINQYSAIPPTTFIPPKVFQMPQDSEV